MDKNKKLIYCILGSFFLTMLTSPFFEYAESALYFGRPYGTILYGLIIHYIINILSFLGLFLFIIFSIILIISNINFNK